MADLPPPLSPPSTSTDQTPISPISSRTATFPHKTSPAVMSHTPLIDTNQRAINDAPVELDGDSGVSVEEVQVRRRGTGDEGEDGGSEKRAAILATRAKDPSVIVDVPREPTAEEVEAARRGEGPGMRGFGR